MTKTKNPGNRVVCATSGWKVNGGPPMPNAVASCAYHPVPGVETGAQFRVVTPKMATEQNENWPGAKRAITD